MPFPRKYQRLIETQLSDLEVPDYVWLNFSVCALEQESCGWAGWTIEGVYKRSAEALPTGTGDRLLEALDGHTCPRCGRQLFRTAASLRLEPSADQQPVHGVPGVDYAVRPVEYTD